MQKPSWISTNLNLGTVFAIAVAGLGAAYGYGELNNRLSSMEAATVRRDEDMNEKFASIARTLERMPDLSYRLTAAEEAVKGVQTRMDSSISNISSRLAEINVSIGGLNTSVAVLANRLDSLTPQQRTELEYRLAHAPLPGQRNLAGNDR